MSRKQKQAVGCHNGQSAAKLRKEEGSTTIPQGVEMKPFPSGQPFGLNPFLYLSQGEDIVCACLKGQEGNSLHDLCAIM